MTDDVPWVPLAIVGGIAVAAPLIVAGIISSRFFLSF